MPWCGSTRPAAPRRGTPREVVLDQRNLSFTPHVLAVQVGTTVKFPNDDRVFHNVFSFHDGHKFDLGLYPVGAVKQVPFDRPGLSRIFCNIHPKMAAYVMVVDTPYFAVSDQAGALHDSRRACRHVSLPRVAARAAPFSTTRSTVAAGTLVSRSRWP